MLASFPVSECRTARQEATQSPLREWLKRAVGTRHGGLQVKEKRRGNVNQLKSCLASWLSLVPTLSSHPLRRASRHHSLIHTLIHRYTNTVGYFTTYSHSTLSKLSFVSYRLSSTRCSYWPSHRVVYLKHFLSLSILHFPTPRLPLLLLLFTSQGDATSIPRRRDTTKCNVDGASSSSTTSRQYSSIFSQPSNIFRALRQTPPSTLPNPH